MLSRWPLVALSVLPWTGAVRSQVQEKENSRQLMAEVCRGQIEILQRTNSRLRYEVVRRDRKGETTRDLIESRDGAVARLVQHNGQTLTAAENEGDRARLQELLGTNKIQQRDRDEARGRGYGVELLQAFPKAMLFTGVRDAPLLPDVYEKQTVVDFAPDPAFRPNGVAQQVLTKVSGRLWISDADRRLLRADMRNTGDVNLAWGLLAKVFSGGSVQYEQRKFQDLYTFTHIVLHMRVREFMVKTEEINTETTAHGFDRLRTSPSGDDAVRMLLERGVATR